MIDETHKNREHKIKSQKGKVNRRSSIRGTQRFTKLDFVLIEQFNYVCDK